MRRGAAIAFLMALLVSACDGAPPASQAIVAQEHVVLRDGQRIACFEKVVSSGTPRGCVVLVHGATWSGRPDFDLPIRDYSVMDALARRGWDVFAIDVQGYGSSDDPLGENWSNTGDAAFDLDAVVEWIVTARGVEAVDVLGWSWGAQIAGVYAGRRPERVRRLVLFGFTWGSDRPKRSVPTEKFRTNDEQGAASDFVPGCFEEDVVPLFVRECMRVDPVSPNGVLIDFGQNLPLVDPETLPMPVLVLYGEHEVDDRRLGDGMAFFRKLPNPHKDLVILGGGGHAILLEKPHRRWQDTVAAFFAETSSD